MAEDYLLSGNFDVESYARQIAEGGQSVAEQLNYLKQQMSQLDMQLREQVGSHHGKLLTHATSIESLEDILDSLRQHIQNLQIGMGRTTTRLTELFAKTEMRTLQLERLHDTCNLIRAIIRIISLSAKLQPLGDNIASKDIAKAATLVQEFREVVAENNLSGVEIISKDLGLYPRWHKAVIAQSRLFLTQGLHSQNQAQIGNALQAFFVLKCLREEVDAQLKDWRSAILSAVQAVVRGTSLEREKSPHRGGPGTANLPKAPAPTTARSNTWSYVERLVEILNSVRAQSDLLWLVMSKKRDALTHKFLSEVAPASKFDSFWIEIADEVLKKELESAKGMVKQTLEGEYPKLLRHMSDVLLKFDFDAKPPSGRQIRQVASPLAVAMRGALVSLENSYLSKSVSRLFDAVNLAFTDDNPPTMKEIDQIVVALLSEMNVVTFDQALFQRVCHNATKTIQLFAVKAENLLSTDGEASQVVGTQSAGQKRNVAVVNAVYSFQLELLKALEKFTTVSLSDEGVGELAKAVDGLLQLISGAIVPLLDSSLEAVTAIIESIHRENFAVTSTDHELRQCSLYMRELQTFLARVQHEHFAAFHCVDLVMQHTTELARKACDIFVTHAVLVRPLTEGGRLRLAADFAQMELAVSPLCRKVSDIGPAYAVLRAVRPLLFEVPQQIVANPAVGKTVPYSLVIHLLISMSHGELQSPHVTAGWSISRYSQWLLEHRGEPDRLQFLKGTLEAYAKNVQLTGKTEYIATYPLLLDLLRKAFESLCKKE